MNPELLLGLLCLVEIHGRSALGISLALRSPSGLWRPPCPSPALHEVSPGVMSRAQLLEILIASTWLIWVDLKRDCSEGPAHLLVRGVPGERHMATVRLPEGPKQGHESALARFALGRHPGGAASQKYGP